MKASVLPLLLLALCSQLFAQTSPNAIIFDLGGNGLLYSLNYERSLTENLNARFGLSFLEIRERQTEKTLAVMSFPVSANYLFKLRSSQHCIESGIGVMNLLTNGDLVESQGVTRFFFNPFVNLGYRYHPVQKGLTYRAGLSPFYGTKSLIDPTEQGFSPFGSRIQVWGYLGIGYHF